MSQQVEVPKLATRSSKTMVWATFAVVVVLAVVAAAVKPQNVAAAVGVVVVLGVLALVITGNKQVLDPAAGTVTFQRMFVFKPTLDLASLRAVGVVPNNGGTAMLKLVAGRGGTKHLALVAKTPYVEKSQDPQFLGVLADTLAQHAPAGVADKVVAALRAQAAHVGAGRPLAESPLAPYTSAAAHRAATAAGGAGSVLG
jgi:hypothetical protein